MLEKQYCTAWQFSKIWPHCPSTIHNISNTSTRMKTENPQWQKRKNFRHCNIPNSLTKTKTNPKFIKFSKRKEQYIQNKTITSLVNIYIANKQYFMKNFYIIYIFFFFLFFNRLYLLTKQKEKPTVPQKPSLKGF